MAFVPYPHDLTESPNDMSPDDQMQWAMHTFEEVVKMPAFKAFWQPHFDAYIYSLQSSNTNAKLPPFCGTAKPEIMQQSSWVFHELCAMENRTRFLRRLEMNDQERRALLWSLMQKYAEQELAPFLNGQENRTDISQKGGLENNNDLDNGRIDNEDLPRYDRRTNDTTTPAQMTQSGSSVLPAMAANPAPSFSYVAGVASPIIRGTTTGTVKDSQPSKALPSPREHEVPNAK